MISAQHLTVREYGQLTVGDAITDAEADRLVSLGEHCPGFCERGFRSVRFGQYCGVVNTGSRILEVIPKVDGSNDDSRVALLSMLRRSRDLTVARSLRTRQGHHTGPLIEVFVGAFLEEVAAIIRGGLRHEYLNLQADLRSLRGRIDMTRQFSRHFNRPDILACDFDEFTADNRWNQLIKATLKAVRRGIHSGASQRKWIELMGAFEDVTDVVVSGDHLDRLRFDRQGKRYEPAIYWASLVLRALSPDVRAGAQSAPGLLFDMNTLFESTVASVLSERAHASGFMAHAQDRALHLAVRHEDGRGSFALRPDLVIRREGKVVAIVDAKWKAPDIDRAGAIVPSGKDVYQMLAYAAAYQCASLFLVFPHDAARESAPETTYVLPAIGDLRPRLHMVSIDVRGEPFSLMRGVLRFEEVLNGA